MALNVGLSQGSNVKTDHTGLIGNIANQGVRQSIAVHVVQEQGRTGMLHILGLRHLRRERANAGINDKSISYPRFFDIAPAAVGANKGQSAVLLVLVPLDFGSALVKTEHVDVTVLIDVANVGTVRTQHLQIVGRTPRGIDRAKFRQGAQGPGERENSVRSLTLPNTDSVHDPSKNVGNAVAVVVHNMDPLLVGREVARPGRAFYPLPINPLQCQPTVAVAVKYNHVFYSVSIEVDRIELRIIEASRSSQGEDLA